MFKYIPLSTLIGILSGAIGGYIYYTQVVCTTGGCPLTSNPYLTILWGALVGYLISDMFKKRKPAETGEGSK
ncbi:MAG: hypothetical protein IH598_08460 [Bacteroidales bacterium]|nr:hypothetical protein [Bacteroidales bacterium]